MYWWNYRIRRNKRTKIRVSIRAFGRLYPEEVTINILVPMPGTPLELQTDLEILKLLEYFL